MASIVNGLWKPTSINCDIHSLNREYGWTRVRLTNVSGIGTDCIHVLGQAYIIKLIYDHRHCSPITPPSPLFKIYTSCHGALKFMNTAQKLISYKYY